MKTITKAEFRTKQAKAYGNCPFITMGNEEQINFHAHIIDMELKSKYNILN